VNRKASKIIVFSSGTLIGSIGLIPVGDQIHYVLFLV